MLKNLLRRVFGFGKATQQRPEGSIYPEDLEPDTNSIDEIYSLWDFLRFQDNTQAQHLVNVVGFDEWVSMDEIRRRITELFGVGYKNERSLYPYIKTLVDCGLLEASNVGGKRKWRKRDLIIRLEKVGKESKTSDKVVIVKKKKR